MLFHLLNAQIHVSSLHNGLAVHCMWKNEHFKHGIVELLHDMRWAHARTHTLTHTHTHTHTDRSGKNIRSISFIIKYDMLQKNEQFFRKSGRYTLQTRPQVADGKIASKYEGWMQAQLTSSLEYLTRVSPPDLELDIKEVNRTARYETSYRA
jgi:predicted P-loop ATPase